MLSPQESYGGGYGGKFKIFYEYTTLLKVFNMKYDVVWVVEGVEVRLIKLKLRQSSVYKPFFICFKYFVKKIALLVDKGQLQHTIFLKSDSIKGVIISLM